jgi:type I restriction enzyme S subunit
MSGGDLRDGLNLELLADIPCPLFATNEQVQIAAFLDRETAKIDALVAEQEKLIALLKEKRQAVISHAVTKGLDPDAPMKPSGVEWLGDVPEHWEIAHLKRYATRITDGAHVSPETDGGLYDFVSTKDIGEDSINFDDTLKTSSRSYEYLARTGCQPNLGDVLFSKDGTIGRTVVVRQKKDFVVASSLIIISPMASRLTSDYLNYLCMSDCIQRQVERFVKGAGLPRLSIQNLLRVVGIFPPVDEQMQISRFLENRTTSFRRLIGEAERAISLLQERRTALISAAVTGKIDVRGLVPRTAEKVDDRRLPA